MDEAGKSKGKDELVVFSIVKESACSECGRELLSGDFLRKEGDQALCMECADLDRLVYLPRGDAALTRRAGAHSRLRVVVVRWSRTRKRYERQGVLVDEDALERAESECLEDAEAREKRRQRETERRQELDEEFVAEFSRQVRALYPGCPKGEERKIAEHACRKYSGRVGRSAAAKKFEPDAIHLAVQAHARHRFTDYEEFLGTGHSRAEARDLAGPTLHLVLAKWSPA
jgi:hypothetical protein